MAADNLMFFHSKDAEETETGEFVWHLPQQKNLAATEWCVGLTSLDIPQERMLWIPATKISYVLENGGVGEISIPSMNFYTVTDLMTKITKYTQPFKLSLQERPTNNKMEITKVELKKQAGCPIESFSLDPALCKILGYYLHRFPTSETTYESDVLAEPDAFCRLLAVVSEVVPFIPVGKLNLPILAIAKLKRDGEAILSSPLIYREILYTSNFINLKLGFFYLPSLRPLSYEREALGEEYPGILAGIHIKRNV